MAATITKQNSFKPNPATIAAKALQEILWHPIAYAPFAGIVVANAAMPLPWWTNAPLVVGAIGGELFWWRRNWDHIYRKHEALQEKKYRMGFNNSLLNFDAKNLTPKVRDIFTNAVWLKQDIEEKIFADNTVSPKERELLELLEETLLQMLETAKNVRTKIPQEITEAFDTLTELSTNFNFVTRPLNLTEEEKEEKAQQGLSQSTQALRHRMEEAKTVRRLLNEEPEKARQ